MTTNNSNDVMQQEFANVTDMMALIHKQGGLKITNERKVLLPITVSRVHKVKNNYIEFELAEAFRHVYQKDDGNDKLVVMYGKKDHRYFSCKSEQLFGGSHCSSILSDIKPEDIEFNISVIMIDNKVVSCTPIVTASDSFIDKYKDTIQNDAIAYENRVDFRQGAIMGV